MDEAPERVSIVCVAGVDEASTQALMRARRLQRALRCGVRLVCVSERWPGSQEQLDADWFSRWAFRQTGLFVLPEDIQVVAAERCPAAVARLGLSAHDVLIVPAVQDSSTEAAFVSRPLLWAGAAGAGAPLLVARAAQPSSRVLVAPERTFEGLRLLEVAARMSGGAPVEVVEDEAAQGRPHLELVRRTPSAPLAARATVDGDRRRQRRLAATLARAALERGADLIVLSVRAGAEQAALELARVVSCSVLLAPSSGHGAWSDRPRFEIQ